jgi:hypothetical protein
MVLHPFAAAAASKPSGAKPAADLAKGPTVTVTSPISGAKFAAPASMTITASAVAASGSIKRVAFYSGGTLLGTDTASPFSFAWNNVPAGTYVLTAVATDTQNLSTVSTGVTITVSTATATQTAPVVSLTSPANGATFTSPATISATAQASENGGTISSVVLFLVGSDVPKTVYTAPYTATWQSMPAGSYAMYALATDKAGVTTKSAPISITVASSSTTSSQTVTTNKPPTVAITAPASGTAYVAPGTVYLTASASDSDGTVSKVDFYSGTTLIGSSKTAPYAGTWSNVTAGTYSLTAVATDSGGAATRSTAVSVTVNPGTFVLPPGGTEPLVQASNLVYQGAFRVPAGLHSGGKANAGFEWGGAVIGFNPVRNSLFMLGHAWDQFVGEIAVPAAVSGAVSTLPTAKLLQPLSDPTEGLLPAINPTDPNEKKIGGLLPYQGKLYVSGFSYYDGAMTQVLSHFVTGQDLSVKGDVKGPYQVGTVGAGFVAGYFGLVPQEWQAPFGGPVLNGQCCLAIVGRTSSGPASFAIDPAQIGVTSPAPAAPLDYYPSTYPLSPWGSTSNLFNGTTMMGGVVMPNGTRSVLFFGRQGVGPFCYGEGTPIQSLDGTLTSNGVTRYCYDPLDLSKGTHGYPYIYQVWAYDANNLAAVRSGQLQPWSVKPYAVWQLNLPYGGFGAACELAAAYDAVSGRIFLSQTRSGADPIDGALPIVHVFKIQIP